MHRRENTWGPREKGTHRRNRRCWLTDLRFFSLQDSVDINYGSLRPPVHGALLWRLEQTHTIMMMVLIIIRKAQGCETWGTLGCKERVLWVIPHHPLPRGSRKERLGDMWYPDKRVRGSELELRQEEGKGYKSAGHWKWTQRMGGVDLVMILDPQQRRLIRHAHQGSRWRQRQEEKDNLWGKMGTLVWGLWAWKACGDKETAGGPRREELARGYWNKWSGIETTACKGKRNHENFKDIMKSVSPKKQLLQFKSPH